MYISYSGFALYSKCKRAYAFRYVQNVSLKFNPVNSLYGDLVGHLFEKFYQDRLWASPDTEAKLQELVLPLANKIMDQSIRKGGVYDWTVKLKEGNRSLDEIVAEARKTIPRGLASIRQHRLLGKDAAAEVKLDQKVRGHTLGGRADFIMTRVQPHGDKIIIDGKGSQYREQYTNHRQLRWYAMLYEMANGHLPDKLGFLYWRFDPETNMDWSTVTKEDTEALKDSIFKSLAEIEEAARLVQLRPKGDLGPHFLPTPSSECRICDFQVMCPEGQASLSSDTKKKITESLEAGVEDGDISF